MAITHNEITALLWYLATIASCITTGLMLGHWYWPLGSRLDDEYDRGYRKGAHDGYSGGYPDGWYDAAHSENVPRPENAEGRIGTGPGRTYDDITPLAMSLDALEPGELPAPPADLSAWWASELDAVVSNGQSDWYTAMAGL